MLPKCGSYLDPFVKEFNEKDSCLALTSKLAFLAQNAPAPSLYLPPYQMINTKWDFSHIKHELKINLFLYTKNVTDYLNQNKFKGLFCGMTFMVSKYHKGDCLCCHIQVLRPDSDVLQWNSPVSLLNSKEIFNDAAYHIINSWKLGGSRPWSFPVNESGYSTY